MVFTAHHDTIDYRTINDQDLPKGMDGFRVFFISDIHRRNIRISTIKSITKQIDIVAIGGDLTEKGVPLERTKNNIRTLKRLGAPIYFVWGNHDYDGSHTNLHKMLLAEDVTVLSDASEVITKNNESINIIGFDYHRYNEERPEVYMMEDYYTILLTHVPSSFFELNSKIQNRINTVLAGHTHGGQIRFYLFGYYQKGGMKRLENTNVFISEGYGYTMLPFRLQTKSECHVLTFKCTK